jgi:uncharacterized protein YecE (DUF72 family)
MQLRIGTAGWSIPRESAAQFPAPGSHLERYSRVLNAVEINSTFYRMHGPGTFERWAETTPADFRFALKLSKMITHERKLKACATELKKFFAGIKPLGKKIGPILVQLPPSLEFQPKTAAAFFDQFREKHGGHAVCEPRNASWFDAPADAFLKKYKIARVAADPALNAEAAVPGGWDKLVYYRLHGSPRRYYSSYSETYLKKLVADIVSHNKSSEIWCIFDNTAGNAACANALRLRELIEKMR